MVLAVAGSRLPVGSSASGQIRPHDKSAGNGHALLLATGQFRWIPSFGAGQPDCSKEIRNLFICGKLRVAAVEERQFDVLANVQERQQMESSGIRTQADDSETRRAASQATWRCPRHRSDRSRDQVDRDSQARSARSICRTRRGPRWRRSRRTARADRLPAVPSPVGSDCHGKSCEDRAPRSACASRLPHWSTNTSVPSVTPPRISTRPSLRAPMFTAVSTGPDGGRALHYQPSGRERSAAAGTHRTGSWPPTWTKASVVISGRKESAGRGSYIDECQVIHHVLLKDRLWE